MESYINELKSKTLYGALRETDKLADTLQKKLQKNADSFNEELCKFVELPGYEDISIEQIPQLDIPEIQRELIETHRSNLYLNQVLEGKNTFVNIIKGLYNKKHKGWRKFWFPIRKDEEYNKEIKELDEILRTRFEITFLSELTKPASSSVLFSALFPPVHVGLDLIKYGGYGETEHYVLCGAMAGLVMGLFSTVFRIESYNQFFQNEAEYLDKKVEDLMK